MGKMFEDSEKLSLHGYDDAAKKRIREITVAIVESRVAKGEVDPNDPKALKAAIIDAGTTARAAVAAALEYVSG